MPARLQQKPSVHFQSLGCAKNQVDSEVMLGSLVLGGYTIAEDLADAQVAVVNTCSFIEVAREESIEAILSLAARKQEGELVALVVAGCLPQRYGRDLARELPEVDAFVGTGEFQRIAPILDEVLEGGGRGVYVDAGRTHLYDEQSPRLLIGSRHSAYVKIAEGCDRVCAFCAIPGIRGRFQSRTLESVVAEARALGREGVRELNVVSQDTCSWGKDIYGRPRLPELACALDRIEGVDWVRLLYLYPSAVTDALIDVLASGERVLPYIDVPLQHASDRMLKAMRRGTTPDRQRRLLARVRERIPDVVIRTTFIVGFPGETDEDFEELCEFVRESRFDRVGVFRYSDEEGTRAETLADKVPVGVARARYRHLMELQRDLMRKGLEAHVGRRVRVLVESGSAGFSTGRLWSQAPEVDGMVLLKGDARVGEMVDATVTGVRSPDLEAEVT
ncbi:MAG: 30S ribosomal protein S12 methylthiotransferase RimO [Myxococcota bacterium]